MKGRQALFGDMSDEAVLLSTLKGVLGSGVKKILPAASTVSLRSGTLNKKRLTAQAIAATEDDTGGSSPFVNNLPMMDILPKKNKDNRIVRDEKKVGAVESVDDVRVNNKVTDHAESVVRSSAIPAPSLESTPTSVRLKPTISTATSHTKTTSTSTPLFLTSTVPSSMVTSQPSTTVKGMTEEEIHTTMESEHSE